MRLEREIFADNDLLKKIDILQRAGNDYVSFVRDGTCLSTRYSSQARESPGMFRRGPGHFRRLPRTADSIRQRPLTSWTSPLSLSHATE